LLSVAAEDRDAAPADAGLWTVPNALSVLRIIGVPVFLFLVLGPQADGWALAVIMVSGGTDWLDGKLARWLGQYSEIGRLLDPMADRLYMVAVPIAFAVRGIVPWWIVAVLLIREAVLAATLLIYRRRRLGPPEVTYLGKAATFALMLAMPALLAGVMDWSGQAALHAIGWGLLIWGLGLYLWTGVLYTAQAVLTAVRVPVADSQDRRR